MAFKNRTNIKFQNKNARGTEAVERLYSVSWSVLSIHFQSTCLLIPPLPPICFICLFSFYLGLYEFPLGFLLSFLIIQIPFYFEIFWKQEQNHQFWPKYLPDNFSSKNALLLHNHFLPSIYFVELRRNKLFAVDYRRQICDN